MATSNEKALEKSARLVIAHEYFRCDQAFLDFAELAVQNVGGSSSKRLRLRMFDAYARFLHHLYEFYAGVARLPAESGSPAPNVLNSLLHDEVVRIMSARAERIRAGRAPSSENALSYYEEPVPTAFAADFRTTRNRIAHADGRRAGASGELTLPGFYQKYHRYVMLLYEEAYWLWRLDPEKFDWGEIEGFELAVRESKAKTPKLARLISLLRMWLFERELLAAIRSRR